MSRRVRTIHLPSQALWLIAMVWALGDVIPSGATFHYHSRVKRQGGGPRVKKQITCDASHKFSLIDGSCNNLDHPEYGVTGTTFRRILDPVYENDDGVTPRLTGVNGGNLPSPRSVSVVVHDPENHTIANANHMIMQWAQFLDHDLTLTPTTSSETDCCYDELVTGGDLHPDVTTGGPCFPIIIKDDDSYFTTVQSRCMSLLRSAAAPDSGANREHYNLHTPWIDASQVYGTTDDLALSLRALSDGKMAVKTVNAEDFLPEDTEASDEDCFMEDEGDYCFKAGDVRVMVYPGLSALHTIFVRYHNTLCDRLKVKFPSWTDEELYQQARRLVIAVVQKITYNDFMPKLIGSTQAKTYHLLFGDAAYAYNSSLDPTLSNVFATAAYRFGHSMVSDSLTIGGNIVETGDLFNRPKYVLKSMKDVMEAMMSEVSQRTDRWYSAGMTNRMFEKTNDRMSGYDIVARNIQRGRDHGLPSYNEWRDHCGLGKLSSFDELDSGSRKFSQVYSSVDDIQLYSGGVSESTVQGAKVGAVYMCLLAEQFQILKFADRFWFENSDNVNPFTTKQMRAIRKIKLSRVMCDTVDFTDILTDAFKMESDSNPVVSCSSLDDFDFDTFWE